MYSVADKKTQDGKLKLSQLINVEPKLDFNNFNCDVYYINATFTTQKWYLQLNFDRYNKMWSIRPLKAPLSLIGYGGYDEEPDGIDYKQEGAEKRPTPLIGTIANYQELSGFASSLEVLAGQINEFLFVSWPVWKRLDWHYLFTSLSLSLSLPLQNDHGYTCTGFQRIFLQFWHIKF